MRKVWNKSAQWVTKGQKIISGKIINKNHCPLNIMSENHIKIVIGNIISYKPPKCELHGMIVGSTKDPKQQK